MSDFAPFSKAVHAQYTKLAKQNLFVTTEDHEALIARYLASFPEGTNPVYITNTEHDCSCCKNFIKNLGNLVAIIDGKVETVWNVKGLAYPYDVVAASMDNYIKNQAITGIFRSSEKSYGAERTLQSMTDGRTKRWNHFYGEVTGNHFTKKVGEEKGTAATSVQTLKRGLEELKPSALVQVIELIEAKSLYRGEEHLASVKKFQAVQKEYLKLNTRQSELFLWTNYSNAAAHFRNSVIGTLVQDLSESDDLEKAVKSFEAKVAPANYKRPTALVTPRMVEEAMKTIKELDYEDSLSRRLARISDVGVTNVLWVNNETQSKMKGGIENVLMAAAKANVKPKEVKAEEISIDDFMRTVLPGVTGMEVLVKNAHAANFMTLTAPVHDNTKPLFKWPNNFGWSYDGNVTDSIKERVKTAGGNVTNAALRVSLAWFNNDDLDLHCNFYDTHIYFGNPMGILDVDMNGRGGMSKDRKPVENMSFRSLRDGQYTFRVNQYNRRETIDTGFEVEVECAGQLHNFQFNHAVTGDVMLFAITIKNGAIADLAIGDKRLISGSASQQKWNINTEQFVKVNTVLNSPNHWDGNAVGNKHWFFILEGCKTDQPARGIYNEFLTPELDKHRKVFELLGDKTKCPVTDEQLSGLGFSSTNPATVTVKVTGPKLNKIFNVKV